MSQYCVDCKHCLDLNEGRLYPPPAENLLCLHDFATEGYVSHITGQLDVERGCLRVRNPREATCPYYEAQEDE